MLILFHKISVDTPNVEPHHPSYFYLVREVNGRALVVSILKNLYLKKASKVTLLCKKIMIPNKKININQDLFPLQ